MTWFWWAVGVAAVWVLLESWLGRTIVSVVLSAMTWFVGSRSIVELFRKERNS